jgi:HNH endonuclease
LIFYYSLISERDFLSLNRQALERDNYTCQRCGCDGDSQFSKTLVVHHMNESDLDHYNTIGNLVTLCKSCHKKIHLSNKQLEYRIYRFYKRFCLDNGIHWRLPAKSFYRFEMFNLSNMQLLRSVFSQVYAIWVRLYQDSSLS